MMNKKKVVALGLALAMLAGLFAGCGGGEKKAAESKKVYNVGIAQLVQHAALDAANKGLVDGLAAKGFKVGENLKIDQQNAQADQSNLQNIANRFVNNKVDLICAIATPTAQSMANATKDIPIVGTAITDFKSAKLVKDNNKPGTNVTGTNDMNPVKEQVELGLKLAPGTRIERNKNSRRMHKLGRKLYGVTITGHREYCLPCFPNGLKPSVDNPR